MGLGSETIWMDEGYSVWFSGLDWSYLWNEVPRFETHPPLYYMLLKAWRSIAGSGEFALRVPSAVASLGVVWLLFVSGRIIGRSESGWMLGLVAAALAALSQYQIALAGDARPYAFAALGVSLTMAGTLRIVCGSEPDGSRSLPAGAALVLGMALTIWSHVLGLVSAGLAGLILIGWWLVVCRGDRGVFLRLATMAALVVLLCWPQFLSVLDQMTWDFSGFWIEAPGLRELVDITIHVAGLPGLPGRDWIMAGVAGLLLAMGLAGLWSMDGSGGRHGATAAGILVVLSGGYWLTVVAYTYLVQPVILPRTLVFMQPPALLIMAAAPWALARGRAVLATGITALAAICAVGPEEVHTFPRHWKSVVGMIGEDPGTPVLALPGNAQIMMNYYEDRLGVDLDIRTIPGPFPHLADGLPDMISHPKVDRDTVERIVDELEGAPLVWLVVYGIRDARPVVREVMRDRGWREAAVTAGAPLVIRYEAAPQLTAHMDSGSRGEGSLQSPAPPFGIATAASAPSASIDAGR